MKHAFGSAASPAIEPDYKKKQVHGVRCVEVTERGQDCGEADGFWTRVAGLKMNVVTADCIPLLLFRSDSRAVAALHAGWRGTFAGIVQNFFKSLPPELSNPGEWQVILGPSIRANCYEVSEELLQQFFQAFPQLPRGEIEPFPRHLDVLAVNFAQLRELGVKSVEVHPDCTFCVRDADGEFRYRSYRRGDRLSRQYSWIEI